MSAPKVIEIPSRRYGRYLVRSRLGAGGMAEVFLAEATDRYGESLNVALKMMREGMNADAFRDEADLMGLLSHPNLVQRLEVGEAFGRMFIAMEFLIGGDLGEVMQSLRAQMTDFPTGMAVHVAIEVLKALAYFHQAKTRTGKPLGLVHGDVNPANVFFSGDGEVKLGDFGVAKSLGANIGPGEGVAAGKLHYLSPEQTYGETLTPASDLFAVGVMLHELAVGYRPFGADSRDPKAVMAAIRAAKISLPDYIDKPLAQILRRALQAEPTARYRSAGEFAGALFHYALDHAGSLTPRDVQSWLQGVIGLLT